MSTRGVDNPEAPAPARAASLALVYVVGTYPSLTTTFVDREVTALRRLGAKVQVVAVRRPRSALSPEQVELGRDVIYLLPAAVAPTLAGHLRFALLRPLAYFGTALYLATRRHPSLRARVMSMVHFAAGVAVAHALRGRRCDHLHAHFVDRAATLALVASRLLGVPYSVTAHANDIYVSPVLLREKLAGATFVATCTRYNLAHLSGLAPGLEQKVTCIYHGLDLGRYEPAARPPTDRPIILAVGRLQEKKGFTYLLEACRTLRDRGHAFACEIVGEGPLRADLAAQIRRLRLDDAVTLCGALPHGAVVEKYRRAHVFALPSVVDREGGRDGIPNVILEAMAMELPVVSTRLSGIPEVVSDGENGLLVPPGEPLALADALERLLSSPAERERLGRSGRARVAAEFDAERNARRLLTEFEHSRRAAARREVQTAIESPSGSPRVSPRERPSESPRGSR